MQNWSLINSKAFKAFYRKKATALRSTSHFFQGMMIDDDTCSFSQLVPPRGGRGRGGDGWSHTVEEEGEGERGGATMRRKREGRLFSICEITTCLIRGSMG